MLDTLLVIGSILSRITCPMLTRATFAWNDSAYLLETFLPKFIEILLCHWQREREPPKYWKLGTCLWIRNRSCAPLSKPHTVRIRRRLLVKLRCDQHWRRGNAELRQFITFLGSYRLITFVVVPCAVLAIRKAMSHNSRQNSLCNCNPAYWNIYVGSSLEFCCLQTKEWTIIIFEWQ